MKRVIIGVIIGILVSTWLTWHLVVPFERTLERVHVDTIIEDMNTEADINDAVISSLQYQLSFCPRAPSH